MPRNSKIKIISIFWLLAMLLSSNVMAAGLGGIDLDSYLNQPLKARITLIGVPADQVGTVTARMASAEDFRIMGIDQRRLNVPLFFTPKVWRGKAVIEVTSNVPVGDPILQFAVDVSWQRGHLLREYTLFLDPPTIPIAPPVTAPKQPEVQEAQEVEVPVEIVAPTPVAKTVPSTNESTNTVVEKIEPAPSDVQTLDLESTGEGEYGPVATGDTLWRIANDWRANKDYSVNQAMVSIVRMNPSAFVNGDINRLNKGQILRLPSAADIAAVSKREANQIVNQQLSAWREQTTITTAPPIISEQAAVPEQVAGTDVSEAASTEKSQPDTSGGRLELVPPAADELEEDLLNAQLEQEMAAADAAERSDLQDLEDRVALAEEGLSSSREENEQLAQQILELQEQIQALRSGINLDDAELASMQQQMADRAETESSRQAIEDLVADQGLSKTDETKQDKELVEISFFERWWWLGLILLLVFVAFFVFRLRQGGQAETQAAGNFLDAVMLKQEQQGSSAVAQKDVSQESLAKDAEEILKVLEQDDTINQESLKNIKPDNQGITPKQHSVDGTEVEELDLSDVQVRELLDQVEAEKSAQKIDALAHTSTDENQTAELSGLSAEDEVLGSLESDDDSDSDQSAVDDKVETSLDLARAYLAMDDVKAARAILEDVLVQGSEAQQLEARNMLNEID